MDLKKINDAFTSIPPSQTFPVAVRMCSSAKELPEKVRLPQRAYGVDHLALHAIAMARRYGWVIAVTKPSPVMYRASVSGLVKPPPDIVGWLFSGLSWLWGMTKEAGAAAIENMHKFEYGYIPHALIAPLDRAGFEPHVIIQYASPAQIWVLLTDISMAIKRAVWMFGLTAGSGCTVTSPRTNADRRSPVCAGGTGERLVPHPQTVNWRFFHTGFKD